MDQVKEILKKAVQYRFWIAVGIAFLMPIIAYFAGTGSIKAETSKKEGEIKSAKTDAGKYASGVFPTAEYKTLTDKRTDILSRKVNEAWHKLYSRQEHLLDWPDEVAQPFETWGQKWPEDVDPSVVTQTIIAYTQVYPREVNKVYESFRPFDYEEGDGIVVAPVEAMLLRPAQFNMAKPPSYGKVWAAQQKLWIQGVVLDVINRVNGDAQDWDSAPVKQITGLEVASPKAQDQRSAAKGETLELAPEILRPGEESTAAPAAGAEGGEGGMASMAMGMTPGMMGGGGYPGMGGMAGGKGTEPEEVYYLKTEKSSPAFNTAPVYVAVLIDQNRILDLFRAFRESPFSIQVVDFEMSRPTSIQVKKPEKGEENPGFGMMGGGEMLLGGMGMMGGYGGMMPGMGMDSGGYGGMMPGMGMGMGQEMSGMGMGMGMGMGGAAAPKKKGTDISKSQLEKEAQKAKSKKGEGEDEKEKKKPARSGAADPYFNIVEVRIYGQARFYNKPEELPEPTAESAGETAEGEAAPTPADPAQDETAKPAQAEATEPAKPETAEPAKAEATDPAQPETAEPAKAEATDPAQPETTEPAKAETTEPAPAPDPAEEPAPEVKVGEPAQPEPADEPKTDDAK